MIIHQIGKKLRQQIHNFSGELCRGFGKPQSRFVEEMLFGLSSSGSVRLTEIARSLDEPISLHATHKRLSRNLGKSSLGTKIEQRLLDFGAKHISQKTLLIIDPTDLRKKYAEKMEYLAKIRDASEKTLEKGYWLCNVIGCESGSNHIIPLAGELWSQNSPDFISENDQILSLVKRVRQAVNYKGILVYDRGGDRRELLKPWTQDTSCNYLIRQRGDRHLLYKRKLQSVKDIAISCPTPYSTRIVREKNGRERSCIVEFGYRSVRLPQCPERELWLVVAKGFGTNPLMLLTTEPMRKNRNVLWWAVEAYITRWRVEETIRFIKQSYDMEDIRVLSYERLRNMTVLVFAASFFTAVWLGANTKLHILATHATIAAKRLFGIPDFKYYAIADGIKTIFKRIGKGLLYSRNYEEPFSPQMSLW